ncbi:MAG: methionine--tRNA ligase subunit beta [Chloroflexota bacterium]
MDTMSIDQFRNLDLRVAKILAAERVEGTDRLLKLQIDLGTEQRTIVSGIANFRTPEALVGTSIVIVANLEPAKIRGIESQGMLLAAGGRAEGQEFSLLTPDREVPPGTAVS